MIVQEVEEVDLKTVKSYAADLRNILESASTLEKKSFLRTFIKYVEVREKSVRVRYKLPGVGDTEGEKVLPIDTLGGAGGIRTTNIYY
jgi:site-specific DNA recombinase